MAIRNVLQFTVFGAVLIGVMLLANLVMDTFMWPTIVMSGIPDFMQIAVSFASYLIVAGGLAVVALRLLSFLPYPKTIFSREVSLIERMLGLGVLFAITMFTSSFLAFSVIGPFLVMLGAPDLVTLTIECLIWAFIFGVELFFLMRFIPAIRYVRVK